jgi:hypothetical protein
MKKRKILVLLTLLFSSHLLFSQNVKINYTREGKLVSEKIKVNFIDNKGFIKTPHIDSVKFSIIDSVTYRNYNPDRQIVYSQPVNLNFNKKIQPYSPEYYTVFTVFNIEKTINYYNALFDNKIDFNSQTHYRNIEISFGDVPFLTTPNTFIFEQNSNPSPTLFSHEIGHRAFWYLEDELGIKFDGLTYVHMGLLEYFTLSLYNTYVSGEGSLVGGINDPSVRNAERVYKFTPEDSLKIKYTMHFLKDAFPEKIKDTNSNIYRYLYAFNYYYQGKADDIIDNHRGGMIVTSTLWRIRKQIGQKRTDELVAKTILNLNKSIENREIFYVSDDINSLPDYIEWYDLYYGLLQKDKELFNGKHLKIIQKEFQKTGFPVELIKPDF